MSIPRPKSISLTLDVLYGLSSSSNDGLKTKDSVYVNVAIVARCECHIKNIKITVHSSGIPISPMKPPLGKTQIPTV